MKAIALTLLVPLSSLTALAATPNYCHQTVRLIHEGPAILAHIDSGCMDGDVIGYKNSGVLAQNNPEYVTAVITASCGNLSKTKTLRLGREYHGNGYLSDGTPMLRNFGYELDCPQVQLSIAFSTNDGRWDSDYGRNYHLNTADLYPGNSRVRSYQTKQASPNGRINLPAWNFIVNELLN